MLKDENKGILFVIIAGICWGIIGLFTRTLNEYGIYSVQNTFIRNAVAAIGMAVIISVTDKNKFRIKLKDFWMFIGTGICSIVLFNICYFYAIEITTMSVAAVLLYTAPCFVMLMSWLFLKEKLTWRKIIALLLAFIGCALSAGILGTHNALSPFGVVVGLGAGFGYALYSILGSVALKKYDPFTVTFYTFLTAAIVLIPFIHPGQLIQVEIHSSKVILCSVLLGIVSTLIPFLSYTKSLKYLEAGKASIMAFVEPLVATICGIFIFHEKLTLENGAGVLLMFISVILLNLNYSRSGCTRDADSYKDYS